MRKKNSLLLTGILFFLAVTGFGQVKLPKLVSDGMVLQRNTDVKIWGWATPGKTVQVQFLEDIYSSTANEKGEWDINFSNLKAGGPHTMQIISSDTITLNNILIGDVWFCSGQSQMDIDMNRVSPLYEEEIRNAGNNNIRYFAVPTAYDFNSPQKNLPSGKWESISQENILRVSAITYFFADELYRQYQIPVGIIRSSLGGSPAEAWMSEDAIKEFPNHYQEAQKFKDSEYIRQIEATDRKKSAAWYAELNQKDKGYKNPESTWHQPHLDDSNWAEMEIPGYWADEDLGMVNGVVWFRKTIELPVELAGKTARLNMGRIVDADSVFVNGTFVGSVSYQYPPRRYQIPENVLVESENTIVVRVVSNSGRGGFVPDKPYELLVDDFEIDLKGNWHYRLGAEMEPAPGQTFVRWKPIGLFNGMIAPLTNYSIKGVIWYQGESNAERPDEYARLFPAMIQNWREKWNQGDFPFLFVQLHNFMESYNYPTESNWARTREAQMEALKLPNTAMAVAIDLGEWNDIHPLNKKDVAKRLALAARKTAYNENDLVASGPIFQSMKINGKKAVLTFSNVGSGLVAKGGGKLKQFAVAGADKKFVWAKAKIKGNKVIVWSPDVKNPVAVRYAWADNPEGANLFNKEGLPASPFRTDEW
ncbi:MAG: sialate O-acetylesterase [Bacteroidota bacterium]